MVYYGFKSSDPDIAEYLKGKNTSEELRKGLFLRIQQNLNSNQKLDGINQIIRVKATTRGIKLS